MIPLPGNEGKNPRKIGMADDHAAVIMLSAARRFAPPHLEHRKIEDYSMFRRTLQVS